MKHTIFEILSEVVQFKKSEKVEKLKFDLIDYFLGEANSEELFFSCMGIDENSTKDKLTFFLVLEDHVETKIKGYDYKVIVTPGFLTPNIKIVGSNKYKDYVMGKISSVGNSKIEIDRWENPGLTEKILTIRYPKINNFSNLEIRNKYKDQVYTFLKEGGLGVSCRGFSPIDIRKGLGRGSKEQLPIVCYELEKEGKIIYTGITKNKKWVIKELEKEARENFEKEEDDIRKKYARQFEYQKLKNDFIRNKIFDRLQKECKEYISPVFEQKLEKLRQSL